jgi:hypothetical protein
MDSSLRCYTGFMLDSLHQHHLTQLLVKFSRRLDDLIQQVRHYKSHQLPPELIDELACTTGELMLALIDHQTANGTNQRTYRAVTDAQQLRQDVRFHQMRQEQIAEAASTLMHEIDQIIRDDKLAA